MATKEVTRCTWPRCSCKATGIYCSSKPQAKKPKGLSRISAKGKLKKIADKDLVKTDAAFYLLIWQEREHKCENCGKPIHEFSLLLFHHVLPKRPDGGYPQYRHCKWNIWILCWECHDTHDNGNPDSAKVKKLRTYYYQLIKLHDDGKLQPCLGAHEKDHSG